MKKSIFTLIVLLTEIYSLLAQEKSQQLTHNFNIKLGKVFEKPHETSVLVLI